MPMHTVTLVLDVPERTADILRAALSGDNGVVVGVAGQTGNYPVKVRAFGSLPDPEPTEET